MSKLLFLVSEDSYFCSHRLPLAKAAIREGFEVGLATRCLSPELREKILEAGIALYPLQHFNRTSLSPWKQLLTAKEIFGIYRDFRPDIVHHVAMKPVFLGSLIAKLCGVSKIINALGGLGYLFTEQTPAQIKSQPILARIKKSLLKQGVLGVFRWMYKAPNVRLILQNPDDIAIMKNLAKIPEHSIAYIPGAGVNLEQYPLLPIPTQNTVIYICCIARMLWDKGIGELVEASYLLKNKGISVKIILYGLPDKENPAAISSHTLKQWEQESNGTIEWRGFCKDVAVAYTEMHIAALPSYYREGLPKSLLEAASCGRPIVTTDMPGCREVVVDGENGYLVPAKDVTLLADKLAALCEDEQLRIQMGLMGRKRVMDYFSDTLVHEKTLALYR